MGWGRPDGGFTVVGAAECHMGRPICPMKGEQHHPEALSPPVKRLTDESSSSEINNMTVALHNYRHQHKLSFSRWCSNVWEIEENRTTHTHTHTHTLGFSFLTVKHSATTSLDVFIICMWCLVNIQTHWTYNPHIHLLEDGVLSELLPQKNC